MSLPSDPNRTCLSCGKDLGDRKDSDPPCITDIESGDGITGHELTFCNEECWNRWADLDPKRKEGWVSTNDITKEQLNDALNQVGLGLEGVGKRNPS